MSALRKVSFVALFYFIYSIFLLFLPRCKFDTIGSFLWVGNGLSVCECGKYEYEFIVHASQAIQVDTHIFDYVKCIRRLSASIYRTINSSTTTTVRVHRSKPNRNYFARIASTRNIFMQKRKHNILREGEAKKILQVEFTLSFPFLAHFFSFLHPSADGKRPAPRIRLKPVCVMACCANVIRNLHNNSCDEW